MLRLLRWMLAACGMAAILISYSGCGSGGGGGATLSDSGGTSRAPVNVYITDAFSDQYSQVLVTLYEIDGSTDNGQTFTPLYSDTSGQTVDLASLASAAQLLSTVQVPANTTFNQVRVTLGNQVTLVPRNGGSSTTVPIDNTAQNVSCNSTQCAVTLTANTAVTSGALSNLVVDFNLASFQLIGGHVRCSIQSMQGGQLGNRQRHGRLAGTVANLSSTGFDLQQPNSGSTIHVTTSSSTVVTSDNGQTVALANGQAVVVQGTPDTTASTPTLTANSVMILTNGLPSPPQTAEGVPSNVDTTAGTFTLTVQRASHVIPSGGTITVQTNSSTVFHALPGDQVNLSNVSGNRVLVSGPFNSTTQTLTARLVLIGPSAQ